MNKPLVVKLVVCSRTDESQEGRNSYRQLQILGLLQAPNHIGSLTGF